MYRACEKGGAPNRLLVEFVYSNLMLNSISLAARNVRFLLTCLWIYLPGTTLSNLRYVCLFLTKKSTFWATCCGLGERFRLARVNTKHQTVVPVVSSRLWAVYFESHRNCLLSLVNNSYCLSLKASLST